MPPEGEKFKGCWVEGGCNLCLLVELCESGDLFTQLRLRHPGSVHFSEEHLQEMAVQLLSALAYLHRSHIAHRDLKTANILITGDGCLKIADFGLSTVLEPDTNHLTKTMVGTPNYMSPCVLQERPYGTPNDVWGLGCVLFELSALKPAFQAFNMTGLIKKVTAGPPPPMPSCYSEHWRNLVRAMLTKEPALRPSAEELLELEWLQPAVRRVAARFGPELPPGAPDLLERLSDLPPDIMTMMDIFQAQEREEKRRADEAKERRKAAVAKWDPLARAAAAAQAAAAAAAVAKQPKLPPLKPHVPRKPLPRVSRAPGGPGGPPPRVMPKPPAGGGGGDGDGGSGAASPRGVSAAAAMNRVCPRRTTYNGEAGGSPGMRGMSGGRAVAAAPPPPPPPPRRLPHTLPGAAASAAAAAGVGPYRTNAAAAGAAWMGHGTQLCPLPPGRYPQQQQQRRPHCDGYGGGFEEQDSEDAGALALSSRLKSHRPSSAPPDSPVRRTRRERRDGAASSPTAVTDPRVSGRGDGFDRPGLDDALPPGPGPGSVRRVSSVCGADASASACASGAAGGTSANGRSGSGAGFTNEMFQRGNWQQEHPEQQQEDPHSRPGESKPDAAAAAGGGISSATSRQRASALQAGYVALQQQQQQMQQMQHQQRMQQQQQEDPDATFRYLPPMRNISGVCGSSGAGPESAFSGGGGGSGSSEDEYGRHGGGRASARYSCPVLPLPRRANSDMVLRVTPMPTAAPPAAKAPTEAPAPPPPPTSWRTSTPSPPASDAAPAALPQPPAGRTTPSLPDEATLAAAAASSGGAGPCGVGGGSRRPSATASGKGSAAAAATSLTSPYAAPVRPSSRGRGRGGGGGGVRAPSRLGSAGLNHRRASGTGCGDANGGGGASGAAAQTRVGSAGQGSRRTMGTGHGSRHSTGTGSSLGPGPMGVAPPLPPREAGPGLGSAANAAPGAGTGGGGGGREPPPAVILKAAARPSLGQRGAEGSSRPSSVASSRASSAKQQQQQALPKQQQNQQQQAQQRRR
ncbi:hypothetical protein PLESTB_001939300 [Pleodorina starrii]|uniref:non-specific serine/threonine protein kinase n=2 Tax=Pleodorina starrii TaxID=330485 RepID=A0A9W6C3L8_9CHLO|nr:hypothetical protein PLESTB_001939300 [Pleodorina starrii]